MSTGPSPHKTNQQRALDLVQEKSIDSIMAERRGNLEMQVLLRSTIDESKEQKAGGRANTHWKIQRPEEPAEENRGGGLDEPNFEIDNNPNRGRNGIRCIMRKKAMILELFQHC